MIVGHFDYMDELDHARRAQRERQAFYAGLVLFVVGFWTLVAFGIYWLT